MHKAILKFISLLLLVCTAHVAFAQATFQSEKELKKLGDASFEEGKYSEAYTHYSQLVMRNPRNPEYNYLFGVCAIYASPDKEQAVPYLETAASSSDVNKDALFYLGRAYMLTYRFEEAVTKFQDFKNAAPAKVVQKFDVDTYINMCKNGKSLVRNISDWVVVDKKELSKKDFFLAYEIPSEEGKFLIKPNDETFKTQLDLKNKEESVIFLSKANEQIFFSSFGSDGTKGKDIYKIVKLPNGEWSKPQELPATVNSDKDEDYPFLHPDGKTLYFSSKGHNSMGGYDIFKSVYNEEAGIWSEPKSLGFPINSPDDDILYVVDKSGRFGFFASSRTSAYGKFTIYKIDIEKKPADWALVRGRVISNRNEQELGTRITVKDLQDNSLIGVYNSNDKTGRYFLALPNGSSCLFTVENADFKTQSQTINIPLKYELNPMKQELSYDLNTGKLIIKTIFDASDSEQGEELPFIVKQKSKMDITPANAVKQKAVDIPTEDVESVVEEGEELDNTLADTRLSNDDIIRMAYEDAKDLDKEATELTEQAKRALDNANKRNEVELNRLKEAQQLLDEANKFSGDAGQKQILIDKAKEAKADAEALKQDAAAAYSLAKRLEDAAKRKRKEADLALEYAKTLEAASKSENSTDLASKLSSLEKQMEEINKVQSDTLSIVDSYKIAIAAKQNDLENAKDTRVTIVKEIQENQALIAKSQNEVDDTKNKSLKEGLLNEIEGLKQDNLDKEAELKKYDSKIKRLEGEYALLSKEAGMASDIVNNKSQNIEPKTTIAATPKPLPATVPDVVPAKTGVAPVKTLTVNAVFPVVTSTISAPPTDEISYNEMLYEINNFNSEELATAEKIANEYEKETKRLKVLNSWASDLDVFAKEQNENLVKETNPVSKGIINQSITKATALSKEKKQLAAKSKARIDALEKPSNVVVAATTTLASVKVNPPSPELKSTMVANEKATTPVATNNVTAPTFKTPVPEPSDPEQLLALINKDNELNYASALKITQEQERETAKANMLNMWSDELELFIKNQKQLLANTSDEVQKNQINAVVKKAVTISREKRTMANDALAKVEQLKETLAVNTNTVNVSKSISDQDIYMQYLAINKRNNSSLDSTFKIKKEIDKELAQSAMYEKWAQELSKFVEEQRAAITEETDFNQKAYKEKTINEAKAMMNQKKSLATKALLRAELISRSPETAATVLNPVVEKTVSPLPVQLTTPTVAAAKAKIKTLDEELADAERIKDTYEREKAKEDIYKRMAKRAEDEVAKYKLLLVKETNENKKSEHVKEINKQELLAREYPELAKKSLVAAEYYLKNKNQPEEGMQEVDLTPAPKKLLVAKPEKPIVKTTPVPPVPEVKPIVQPEATLPTTLATQATTPEEALFEIYNRFTQVKEDIKLSKNEKFDVEPKAAYTSDNPIPLGKIPSSGLVYMLQVGSFKNAISPGIFGGIKPITVEQTEIGYMRYFAGEFVKFNSANTVKDKIRSIGFKDAFVVAFYNGNRITLGEAFALEGIAPNSDNIAALAKPDVVDKKVTIAVTAKTNTVNNGNLTTASISANNQVIITSEKSSALSTTNASSVPESKSQENITTAASTNIQQQNVASKKLESTLLNTPQTIATREVGNVAQVGGLFYTVQVGVFSQAMSPSTFYNATPLFSENIDGGKMRYNVGVYDNVVRASEAKNILVDAGLTNAFVTAFFNNKRIPVSEAKLHEADGTGKAPDSPVLNVLPSFGGKNPANTLILEQPTSKYANQVASERKTEIIINTNEKNSKSVTPKPVLSITYNSPAENNKSTSVSKIQDNVAFKVQIGAYREQVPIEQANIFVKIADKDFAYYRDANGITIYTAGNFKTYEEAAQLKLLLAQEFGLKDAFITAYKDGKKVPLNEVR